jgi:AhpD family alkylhydroperoxidase
MATTAQQSEKAEQVKAQAEQAFGFTPNLIHVMADANPAAASTYLKANGEIEDGGVLTPAEQQAVILAVSSSNHCHYCTKAHAAAGQAAGLDADAIAAINEGGLPSDARLKALVRATRLVVDKRGWLSEDDVAELEDDLGVDRPELFEIVTLVGIKTISNYVNHIAGTEVDPQFQ